MYGRKERGNEQQAIYLPIEQRSMNQHFQRSLRRSFGFYSGKRSPLFSGKLRSVQRVYNSEKVEQGGGLETHADTETDGVMYLRLLREVHSQLSQKKKTEHDE